MCPTAADVKSFCHEIKMSRWLDSSPNSGSKRVGEEDAVVAFCMVEAEIISKC